MPTAALEGHVVVAYGLQLGHVCDIILSVSGKLQNDLGKNNCGRYRNGLPMGLVVRYVRFCKRRLFLDFVSDSRLWPTSS